MRVDVDQSRQYQSIPAVDHPVRRSGVISSDESNRVVDEDDVDVAAIAVTPGGLVPGDNPIGFLDDGHGHGFLPRVDRWHRLSSALLRLTAPFHNEESYVRH